MKTADFTNEELINYFSEHVRYEVQMLLNATIGISKKLVVPQGLEYMPVESYAIHLRNLISFFYPSHSIPTDVCAKDFFIRETEWSCIRPIFSEVLKNAKKRADREVGHLTTSRQSGMPESKMWNVELLTSEIMPIFKTFCDSATKVKIDSLTQDIWRHYSYFKTINNI